MVELRQELLGKGGMDPHFREPNLTLLQDTTVGSDCPKMAAHSEFQSVDMFNKNSNQVFLITFFLPHTLQPSCGVCCHNTLAAVAGRFESSNHQSEPWRGASEASFACSGGAKRIQEDPRGPPDADLVMCIHIIHMIRSLGWLLRVVFSKSRANDMIV